jgi:hypothetical protein
MFNVHFNVYISSKGYSIEVITECRRFKASWKKSLPFF